MSDLKRDSVPHDASSPRSSDGDEQLSYDQRVAAASEAVRQLTSYFERRE
jgi:hypothetical protein